MVSNLNESAADNGETVLNQKFLLSTSVASIVINAMIICVIITAKCKLILIEFHILIQLALLSFFYSICSFSLFVSLLIDIGVYFQYQCYVMFFLEVMSVFGISVVMTYYSLFHLSFLARYKFFLQMNKFIRNVKHFLVYSMLCIVLYVVLSVIIGTKVYVDIGSSRWIDLCEEPFRNRKINVLVLIIIPSLLVCFVNYLMAIVFVSASRLRRKLKYAKMDEQKRFKRNLKLVVKFFLFNLLNLFKTAPLCLMAISNISNNFMLSKFTIFLTFPYLVLLFQPIMLVLIHNILKKQAKELIFKYARIFLNRC